MTEQKALLTLDTIWKGTIALLIVTVVFAALMAAPGESHGPQTTVQIIQGTYEPTVIYDAKERELRVTEAMPRDTLLCLRGECRLVEEWIERKP